MNKWMIAFAATAVLIEIPVLNLFWWVPILGLTVLFHGSIVESMFLAFWLSLIAWMLLLTSLVRMGMWWFETRYRPRLFR